METYPVLTADGSRPIAFEIENIYISLAEVARLLAEVDAVTDIKKRRPFSSSSDIHVEFKYRGQPYVVWEAYGDNSRFWIGPKETMNDVEDITRLEAPFKRYRPPFHRALLGDVLTLRVIGRLLGRGHSKS